MLARPFLPVALAYVAGVVLARVGAGTVGAWWAGVLALALATAAGALLRPRWRAALLWPLLLLTGAANLACREAVLSPVDLRTLVGDATWLTAVRGRLLATPSERVTVQRDEERLQMLVWVRVEAVRRDGLWTPAYGDIVISYPDLLPAAYCGGSAVEATGVLQRPPVAIAPGLFDYRAYLRNQGVYYQLATRLEADWRLLEAAPVPWADRFSAWARRTLARGLPVEDEPLRLLWAMTLGWKTGLTDEVSESFMRSGTMHIFAISGLHIAMIAGILVAVLRVLQVPRAATGLVVIPLLWFYTGATGWQSSAVRSTLMMSVVIAGWALRRPGDLLNSLGGAGVLILLWEPRQLFQASFQLSFFVVLSIALLVPPLEAALQRWLEPDPLLPPELRPRWRRWLDRPLRWLLLSSATSLAAWLGSLPLVAQYFHLCTPVSLVANLAIVPLSGLALMSNLGSLVCGVWCSWGAELFNHAAWFWMRAMVWLSETLVRVPGAYVHVRGFSALGFGIYYGTLVAVLSGWAWGPARRRWTATALTLLALGLVGAYGVRRAEVRVTVLPTGNTAAVLVDAPGEDRLLVDCGNESAVGWATRPFLMGQGVNRLPNLALTHGDVGHVGGARPLAIDFGVRQVWVSPVRFRSTAYRNLIEDAQRQGVARLVGSGDRLAGWEVLHPAATNAFSLADDNALVLRRSYRGVRVLLLSDLGPRGQQQLLEKCAELRAEIAIAGRPSQGEPLTPPLLEAIRPQLIVLTEAAGRAARSASAAAPDAVVARLQRSGATVWCIPATGAVTLRVRGDRVEARRFLAREPEWNVGAGHAD